MRTERGFEMRYDDLSQNASEADVATLARADVDALPPGVMGPATGNTITGNDTISGQAGADSVADPPGIIIAVQGAGSTTPGANGSFTVVGQHGVLTIQADGSYTYVRNAGTLDGVNEVFTYTLADQSGQQSTSTLTIEVGSQPPSDSATAAIASIPGVVTLPSGVELSDIRVVGRDLVIELPDGTQMVIPGGAVFVPQLIIGDVELPASNLAALLIDSEPQPAAGPPQSSGGNFEDEVPPLDPGVPYGDLIPPVDSEYTPPAYEEVANAIDREPTVLIVTPGNPAGAVNATDSVDESGLPTRGSEPEGTLEPQDIETTTGTIVFTAEDGLQSITINGVTVAAVGQQIVGDNGILTITSINLATGEIGYTYTVTDNTADGVDDFDDFTVVVTDSDSDTATATLHIDIADDEPIALDDTDTVDIQTNVASGNVMTGAGTTSGAAGSDTVGADDAQLTAVSGAGGSDSTFDSDGNLVVEGQYGTLTIDAAGNYTYVLYEDAPGGSVDEFVYTLVDGDGDTVTATLTIANPDSQPTVGSNLVVQLDDDALSGGNPGGSGDDPNAVNTSGTLSGSGGDGALTFSLLETGAPEGFTYVLQANGDLWVMQGSTHVLTVTVDSATGNYTVMQVNPIDHPEGSAENNLVFTVNYTVTDSDGDTVNGTLDINVDDDTPLANDDTDIVNLQTGTATGNVITGVGTSEGTANADSPGADGFDKVTGIASNNVPANSDTTADGSGNYVVEGQYGTLTLNEDGTYTYVVDSSAPGGGTDVFTYTYVDADGDTVTATLTITISDAAPVANAPDAVMVDDDDVGSDGNPGGTGDDDPANATGTLTATGGDGDVDFFFDLTATAAGLPPGFSLDPASTSTNLLIMQGTTLVMTVTLDSETGAYTVTQNAPVVHADGGDENNAGPFNIAFYAQDSDGSQSANQTLAISVDDDTPVDIAPVDLTDTTFTGTAQDDALVNDGTANVTRLLNDSNNDGTGENFIGADGFGSLAFTGGTDGDELTDANGNLLKSGGEQIYLWGYGTDTLTAYVESGDNAGFQQGEDIVVFIATLDQGTGSGDDATYTIEFQQPIDDGSGVVFDDFSKTPAGQNDWIGIDGDRVDTNNDGVPDAIDIESPLDPNPDSEDLLITPTNAGGTINTSSTDIGNSNQWIDEGEGVRLDFVTDLRRDAGEDEKDFQGYEFDGHYNVTNAGFTIMQTQGGGLASVHITAVFDDDTGTLDDLDGSTVAIDPASITVFDADGGGEIDIIDMGDGTFVITGLEAGDTVSFETVGDAPFNAVEIESAVGLVNPDDGTEFFGAPFALGEFGFTSETQGAPIDMSFDVTATDADGDTSTGTIDVTLVPAGSTTTTTTTPFSTQSTESQQIESSSLLASNDNNGAGKGQGQGQGNYNAILFGAVAAAGLASQPAAATDGRGHANANQPDGKSAQTVESDDGSQLTASDTSHVQSLPGEAKTAVADAPDSASGDTAAAELQPLSVGDVGASTSDAPGEMPQGMEAAAAGAASAMAITADAVAMPSAAMIAAATLDATGVEGAGEAQSNQIVGKVLADALAGGGDRDAAIDAALSQLSTHGVPGLDPLASHDAGAVSAWDGAGMTAFAAAGTVFSAEVMMLHQDAPPAANS